MDADLRDAQELAPDPRYHHLNFVAWADHLAPLAHPRLLLRPHGLHDPLGIGQLQRDSSQQRPLALPEYSRITRVGCAIDRLMRQAGALDRRLAALPHTLNQWPTGQQGVR